MADWIEIVGTSFHAKFCDGQTVAEIWQFFNISKRVVVHHPPYCCKWYIAKN